MKYVRTKDGIYSLNAKVEYQCWSRDGVDYVALAPKSESALSQLINKDNILKQANTIEQLCDEFVVWEENYKNPISCPLTEKEQYERIKRTILLGIFRGTKCWLKLAIWTDKGLIYVAKMNGKGELELL